MESEYTLASSASKGLKKGEFETGLQRAEEISGDLVNFCKVRAVVIEGIPPFAIKGPDFEAKWA